MGNDPALEAMRNGQTCVILVANDLSKRTLKGVCFAAEEAHIDVLTDVYKRQNHECTLRDYHCQNQRKRMTRELRKEIMIRDNYTCLLYTSRCV